MKLEILGRSGHIEGCQLTSPMPQHARICSPCSQGSVIESNSQTRQERERVSYSWIRASKIRSKRKKWSLQWLKQDCLSHTGNTFPLFMDFPCPLTLTNKAVCTRNPHEREGVKLISTSQEKVLLVQFIQP